MNGWIGSNLIDRGPDSTHIDWQEITTMQPLEEYVDLHEMGYASLNRMESKTPNMATKISENPTKPFGCKQLTDHTT